MSKPYYQPFWYSEALSQEADSTPQPLSGDCSADLCIIGGGYTGLWTAIKLKQQKPEMEIVIIDKGLCGSGASGRNGGCMLTWSTKYFSLRRLFGEEEACRLVRASEEAPYQIRNFCREHNIDAQVRLDGTLYTSTNEAQLGGMEPTIKALTERRLNSWMHWSPEQVKQAAGSQQHIDGYYSPAAGSLQPGLLVRGMKRVAEAMGVRIYENTAMDSIEEGHPARVKTPHGEVKARQVVLAINAWTPKKYPQFNNTVVLVSSDMAITEPVPEKLAAAGLDDGKAVVDSRIFVHYYRTTPDGRLMLGKGGNMFAFNNQVYPAFDQPSRYQTQLQGALNKFFPYLKDTPIERTWTGPSDRSATGFPFFGRLNNQSNIFYGLGYSGNGVCQSYMGGEILASLVLGLDNEWTRSGLVKGPLATFPPEPIRWLGAMTVRNAIRRKENAEDAGNKPWWIDKQLAKFANAAGKSDKG
ncbi:FAD-dependent oxidoreductase [Neptuniibacter halophilus]|uniref:FAD-dependent oxidoreductase n=1 Tax=Neptuniibacter halophilus TaxID=651666 RepID=UPI002572A651|nr:FAD-dependent oxidoreductase [Neptuniibacter halophilus]